MYAASQEGHHKVYIVDEAHMLTREAWNALLKILEEPPPGVVFVFATTEPQKIAGAAAPVMSRLQRFDFRRIGPTAIRDRLRQVLTAEGIAADDDALTLIATHADGGMRDALSVLDQCLSFGEGAVTADRVREVLGLVNDELYAEVLQLVVERRPAQVFGLVDRLMDAGLDLAEFMAGAAEMLRGLLMLQVGARPEGITEALRTTLESYQGRLQAGDVLRMLRLLAENEMGIRRTVNPRLAVETLLLRWAMLDRIVDLEQVLGAGKRVGGEAGKESGEAGKPEGGSVARGPSGEVSKATPEVASTPAATPSAASPPTRLPASRLPTLESIRAAWPAIVAALRAHSRFLGEALAASEPATIEPPWLTVAMSQPNPLFADRLHEEAGKVEEVLSRSLGEPIRLRVTSVPAPGTPAKPRRMSESSLKAERLREFRSKDPALDTAADALDLEIVD
jgi:DNA polymerase-3 subunit gamma/tau